MEHHAHFDNIKWNHAVSLLPVYTKDKFVEIRDAEEVLQGALVNLQFELHHYKIQQKDIHSFNGNIEQITVIQPGKGLPVAPYKRRDMREGLHCPALHTTQKVLTGTADKEPYSSENEDTSTSAKKLGKQKAIETEDETDKQMASIED